jgi:hypothetical protein
MTVVTVSDDQRPIEYDLIESAMVTEITVTGVDVSPTSTGDRHVWIAAA